MAFRHFLAAIAGGVGAAGAPEAIELSLLQTQAVDLRSLRHRATGTVSASASKRLNDLALDYEACEDAPPCRPRLKFAVQYDSDMTWTLWTVAAAWLSNHLAEPDCDNQVCFAFNFSQDEMWDKEAPWLTLTLKTVQIGGFDSRDETWDVESWEANFNSYAPVTTEIQPWASANGAPFTSVEQLHMVFTNGERAGKWSTFRNTFATAPGLDAALNGMRQQPRYLNNVILGRCDDGTSASCRGSKMELTVVYDKPYEWSLLADKESYVADTHTAPSCDERDCFVFTFKQNERWEKDDPIVSLTLKKVAVTTSSGTTRTYTNIMQWQSIFNTTAPVESHFQPFADENDIFTKVLQMQMFYSGGRKVGQWTTFANMAEQHSGRSEITGLQAFAGPSTASIASQSDHDSVGSHAQSAQPLNSLRTTLNSLLDVIVMLTSK